ncbi:nitrous oxide reductase accessory protein NosL [bacterium]|nr:nitrous oxide reductase accessory protein NosL [bacterium]MBU1989372.1 nitrous oxide reductase accessory protein NosL [bacterium]
MRKIVLTLFIGLLLLGCSSKNDMETKGTMHMNHKMFQSVDEKQALLVQEGKDKRYCTRCGMDLVKFYKTSHTADAEKETKKYQYCSIHCLAEHLGEGITLKNPKVVDVNSLELISIADAFYVVGSKKRGTMSKISKYAFSNIKDAKIFQAQYGGEIMDFNKALEKAKEDFIR